MSRPADSRPVDSRPVDSRPVEARSARRRRGRRDRSDRRAGPHVGPDRRRGPRAVRQHSPLMSPLVWDLAHVGQQEDLWLLREGDPRRQGILPARIERLYDAFEHPRAQRPSLPLLPPAQARSFLGDVRARVLDRLDRLDRRTACAARRTPRSCSPTRWSCSTRTSTARRCWPPTSCGRARRSWRPAWHFPRGGRHRPDAVLVPAGEFVLGVDAVAEPTSLDNERPGARRRPAGVPHRPGAGEQRAVAALHRRRRLRRAPLVVGPRLAPPGRGRSGAPPVLVAGRQPPAVRDRRGHPARRAGPARVLLRGRRPTPRGPADGCPPRPSGRRRAAGIRSKAGAGAGRGGPRRTPPPWPTSAGRRCAPPRWAPTRPAHRRTGWSS